jgi:hypothetical protein
LTTSENESAETFGVGLAESVTWAENVKVPETAGVPKTVAYSPYPVR